MSRNINRRTAVAQTEGNLMRGFLISFIVIGLALACVAVHKVLMLIQTLIAVLS